VCSNPSKSPESWRKAVFEECRCLHAVCTLQKPLENHLRDSAWQRSLFEPVLDYSQNLRFIEETLRQ
jgi:hypothetical protein